MKGPVLGVIPARLGSTRLPRKPLRLLRGRPLVEWVWARVRETGHFDRVVIATDSEEVLERARSFGAEVFLTDPDHPSGTDRVAEIARLPEFQTFPLVVNIQGDEPLVEGEHLAEAIRLVGKGGWPVGTCATPLGTLEAWRSPDVVKVVRGADGGALYFSRAPIPAVRDEEPTDEALAAEPFLRHLGVYAFRREALLEWVELRPEPLERLERLEQLRALAQGIRIGVAIVRAAARGVDTEEDARRVEALLAPEPETTTL